MFGKLHDAWFLSVVVCLWYSSADTECHSFALCHQHIHERFYALDTPTVPTLPNPTRCAPPRRTATVTVTLTALGFGCAPPVLKARRRSTGAPPPATDAVCGFLARVGMPSAPRRQLASRAVRTIFLNACGGGGRR